MPNNYVLIDFENIQPEGLQKLVGLSVKVMAFVGENQTRIPLEFVTAMQQLGTDGRYIKMSGNGPNALDFHIAYYVGALAATDPTGYFHIISKDTGFDPLIRHLRTDHMPKIRIYRCENIGDLPFLRPTTTSANPERVKLVVENFRKRGDSLPKTLTALHSTVKTLIPKNLPESETSAIIDELERIKFLKRADGAVTYANIGNGKTK